MLLRYQRLFFIRNILTFTFKAYNKTPTDASAQVIKLKSQGLAFVDEVEAERVLTEVGYFRFRGYLYPYFDLSSAASNPRQFKSGANFTKALEMYRFDVGLRRLFFSVLPEVEIALRSTLDAAMCRAAGHGFWYLDKAWFQEHPQRTIQSLQADFGRSSEAYALHYHQSYYNDQSIRHKGMPPFWVISELTTLGQMLDIYKHLKETAPGFPPSGTAPKSTALDKMAHGFGAPHYRDLVSWINVLRDTRNVCAHHGRLWNRNLIAPTNVGSKVSVPFPPISSTNRSLKINTAYAAFVVLRLVCKGKRIDDGIHTGLLGLFRDFPEAINHLTAMGIPVGWEQDTIWT